MNRRIYSYTALAAVALMAIIFFFSGPGSVTAPADNANSAASADASPSTQPAGSILPAEYAILQNRTPFGRSTGPGGGPGHGGPEDSFIFRGAIQTGSTITAFIEDANKKDVAEMSAGDSLAGGRIKSIDLDAIQYESTGNSRRIEVGQNLNGQTVQPPPTTAPSPPPGANPPSPGNQNGPPMPPNMQMPPGAPRPNQPKNG